MEAVKIKRALDDVLQKPEDNKLINIYCDSVVDYLEKKKSDDEIISIVIQGINIDRAANFYDYLLALSKKELESVWKQIRKNKELKENKDNNGLKFLTGMLSLALMQAGNMDSLCGNVVTLVVAMLSSEKKYIPAESYKPVLMDYLIEDFGQNTQILPWNKIDSADESNKKLAEIILDITQYNEEKYVSIRKWAAAGIRRSNNEIKRKQIEKKIPPRKVQELQALVDHYSAVENRIHSAIYENAKLEDQISELQKQIDNLLDEKRKAEGIIHSLNKELENQKMIGEQAKKEVEERKKINNAFTALKKNDEEAILKDIASDLKAIYKDFVLTKNDQMDEMLGEIYREKLRSIFKILEKKGIRVE